MPSIDTRTGNPFLTHEDWWAIWLGGLLTAATVAGVITVVPGVSRWSGSPLDAFGTGRLVGIVTIGLGLSLLTTLAVRVMGHSAGRHFRGFLAVFALSVLAHTVA